MHAPLDCTRCGACCSNPDENRREGFVDYIEVEAGDALLQQAALVRRLVVYNDAGVPHLRLDPSGRCAALRGSIGRRVSCTVYERRPSGCRRVTAGSARCLQYRVERGVRER